MIRHTVSFRLRHPLGSSAERDFLMAANALASIPGVEKFEILHQVQAGKKCAFTLGISMEFADASRYAVYNDHPDHVRFVHDRWLNEVEEFLELDYTPYTPIH